uniref:Uncharacterized protein n=1 Tax=Ditylenchus dipsaci TaxID=166011 RepID=A0A915EEY8_9BILA
MFPLYADKSSNAILSVPEILESTGMSASDKTAMLELVMEASEDAFEIIKEKSSLSGLIDDINGISDLIASKFTNIKQSMNGRQRRDMQRRKYTFMTKQQLEMIYGQEGIFFSCQ